MLFLFLTTGALQRDLLLSAARFMPCRMLFCIVDAFPIHRCGDLCDFRQFHAVKRPFFKLLKSGAVHNIANVFLAARCGAVDIVFHVFVGIQDDLNYTVLIRPFDEVFAQTRVSLSGSSKKCEAVIFLDRKSVV